MMCTHQGCTGVHKTARPSKGIICPAAKEREAAWARKRSREPGYAFDRMRGIGRPGLVRRIQGRRVADARDAATLEALVAAIEGIPYGPSH